MKFLHNTEYHETVGPIPTLSLSLKVREAGREISLPLRSILVLACILFTCATASAATCDQYPGDLWAYSTSVKPNFLIIIDTSGSMSETVPGNANPYGPAIVYSTQNACRDSSGSFRVNCSTNRVYRFDSRSGNWLDAGFNRTSVTTTCDGSNPNNLLDTTGQYIGRSLTSSGGCGSSGSNGSYRLGNWINWNEVSTDDVQKIVVAREVIRNLVASASGVNIGVMIYNNIDSSKSKSDGARFFTYNIGGATYTSTIKDMEAIHYGTMTNRQALLEAINSSTVKPLGYTPLAESLVEAGQYFRGGPSLFGNTIGVSGSSYVTPVTAPACQDNVIVFITDGMSTSDDHADLKNICPSTRKNCQGDYDGDRMEPTSQSSGDDNSTNMWHAMDDVAKFLYDTDLLPGALGMQNVSTYTIGFGQIGSNAQAVSLLQRTADDQHGHGASYLAENQTQLSNALGQIFSEVVSMNSSLVVPVVPITPEASGKDANRLYMGFFKTPMSGESWVGNLKKYALDASNNIKDKMGDLAIWTDADHDGKDDNDGVALPAGAISGSFRSTSISYWSSLQDGGTVTRGGAGERLLTMAPADRAIYTYTGTTGDLTHSSNSFTSDNNFVTAALLGVPGDERTPLIDFTRGVDVDDLDHDDLTTDARSWLFGDILHSRPLVVNYASYTRTAANEGDCTKNKNVVYVGANDGMLHAINDCDGSERWAFIPPDILENLKEIKGRIHTYGVDASPVVYRYDANNNGVIDKGDGDKAILLLGTRRGGGESGAPTTGAYHLLDVTDPTAPVYLWSVSSGVSFAELAESWAEPRIVRMKVGSAVKIVAFLPGGYDNANEDGRYGATQNFSGTAAVYNFDSGSKQVTSSGSSNQDSPRGRGLYAVELATIQANGRPSLAATPTRLWGVVHGSATDYEISPATDSRMTYSLTGDVAVLDVNGDGYTDRVYAADLGGGLWRFDVGLNNPLQWSGQRIFNANPAAVSVTGNLGRKVFYKPAVTLETKTTTISRGLDATIFMGTGDREHPNNTAVVDRIYAIKDKGQTSAKGEGDLVDLTDDALQAANASKTAVDSILASLRAASNYGWYIRLDQHPGEKVLASPTVFNRIVYFTTYAPSTRVNPDPCEPNVGTSRLYAVSYTTGEAVFNFDRNNDTTTVTNTRSKQNANVVMLNDRFLELGQGIASGVAVKGNDALIGTDGRILKQNIGSGKRFIPLYWGQR